MMIRKIVKKAVNMLHINQLIFKLFAKHEYVEITPDEVKRATDFLKEVSPNPSTSCITTNTIYPEVDIHIIVPAYNVEKYLRECLDSVVKAEKKYTYRLTVVNDGSLDGTGDVLKEYEDIPSVQIITQENKGFSGARNTALKHIVGKYILFLDSDDYVDYNGVEKMLDIAFQRNYDVVQGAYTTISESGEIFKCVSHGTNEEVSPASGMLTGFPWGKVIKSEYFADIQFPEKYWFEDSIFAAILCHKFCSAYIIRDNVYYYRLRKNSISHTATTQKKSIDSFWITKNLDLDRKILGIQDNQVYYEYILCMVKLTYRRTKHQPENVKRDVFILFADFIKNNFSAFRTRVQSMKNLEKAVDNGDYGYYKCFCEWM